MLRETIKELTRQHLDSGAKLYSQSICGPKSCADTIPENHPNLFELPIQDSSNGFFVVGAAIAKTRPVYLIRFQPFSIFNGNMFSYMGASKTWGKPCPLFIRAMGNNGSIGPVASGAFHTYALRFPGVKVVAPMNSKEYGKIWGEFLTEDDPIYCSESRRSYGIELDDSDIDRGSEHTLISIGETRLFGPRIAQELNMNYVSLYRLKPLNFSPEQEAIIRRSNRISLTDWDVDGGLANLVQQRFNLRCDFFGISDKVIGFSPERDFVPDYTNYVDRIRVA
ncbi:MAG: hypothetical protein ACHQ1D_01545 [Nitrososphaerales archaeon]